MKKSDVKVTVIVILYNHVRYIDECISGVLSQTYPIDELIISDDCSDDGSFEKLVAVIDGIDFKDYHIGNVIIRKNVENLGIIKHYGLLVDLASNDLIIGCAGDDISYPNRVESVVEDYLVAGRPKYYLVHSAVSIIGESDCKKIIPPVIEKSFTVNQMATALALHIGATQAHTKSLITSFGPIVRDTYEDLVLGFRAALMGGYRYIDRPLVHYRPGGISAKGTHTPEWLRRHARETFLQRINDAMLAGRYEIANYIVDEFFRNNLTLIMSNEMTEVQGDLTPSRSRPKVSVGLITYNNEDTVGKAIDSIFLQGAVIDELIISDDCSVDGTWEVIERTIAKWQKLKSNVKEIRLIRGEKNLGYLENFKKTVFGASGDIFVFHAGDDRSEPDRVECLLRAYENAGSPDYALIHSSVYFDNCVSINVWRPPVEKIFGERQLATSFALHIGASEAFTRNLFLDFGGIDEETYDDLILGFRAALLRGLIYVDKPLLWYGTSGITSGKRGSSDFDKDRRHVVSTALCRFQWKWTS